MPPPAINTRVLMPLDFGFSGGQFPDRSKPAHTGYRGRKQQRQHKAGVCLNGVADGTRTHDDQNHNLGLYQLSYSHRKRSIIAGSSH
jgi:hypothetical protein